MLRRKQVGFVATGLLVLAGCRGLNPNPNPVGQVIPQANDGPQISNAKVDKSAPETARVCIATAEVLERGDKLQEALALYDRARQTDPSAKHVARRMAVIYDRIGDFDKARAEYDKALALTPNNPDILTDLGYGFYCRGQWDLAEKNLRAALAVNPKHQRAWTNLGMTLGQKGQYQESLEAFTKVVNPAQANCNLAFILTTQGKREEAKRTYREALILDPGLQKAREALVKLEEENHPQAKDKGRRGKQARLPETRPEISFEDRRSLPQHLAPLTMLESGALSELPNLQGPTGAQDPAARLIAARKD